MPEFRNSFDDLIDTQTVISKLRRLSGLTWERLAEVLGISRRTLHFWASGRPIHGASEKRLFRMLAVLKAADRGSARENRAMLLTARDGTPPIDLLTTGRYAEFLALVGEGPGRRSLDRRPLSAESAGARKPPPPGDLVDTRHDRIHRDVGHGRAARTLRNKQSNRDG